MIILNSSTVNTKGWPGIAIYSATKAAVRSLARSFAAELLPRAGVAYLGSSAAPAYGDLAHGAHEPHVTKCVSPNECIFFISQHGKFDYVVLAAAKK